MNLNQDQREILERICGFTKILEDDTMSDSEIGNMRSMRKSHIEKLIQECHKYAVCYRSTGYYQTKTPDGKTISSRTMDGLYEKLFKFYFGDWKEPTVNSLFPLYITEKATYRSSKTVHRIECDWKKYIREQPIANKPVKKIEPYQMMEFYRSLVGDEQMKRRAFNNIKSIFNEVFDYAVIHNGLKCNPSRLVKTKDLNFAPDNHSRKDYFSEEEQNQIKPFLRTMADDMYANAIMLQFSLGCRIGELIALSWDDLDVKSDTVWIHKEAVRRKQEDGKDATVIVYHTKGKKKEANRELPLSEDALWAIGNAKRNGFGVGSLIFSNQKGEPMNANSYNYYLKRYCKQAGIEIHSSHDIRRYIISAELEAGLPDVIVQHNSGHLNYSTTLSYKREVGYRQYRQAFLDVVSGHLNPPSGNGNEATNKSCLSDILKTKNPHDC